MCDLGHPYEIERRAALAAAAVNGDGEMCGTAGGWCRLAHECSSFGFSRSSHAGPGPVVGIQGSGANGGIRSAMLAAELAEGRQWAS